MIKPETSVTTLMGPGQWQAFALDVGDYDLMEITIERSVCWLVHARSPCCALSLSLTPLSLLLTATHRREYDNATFAVPTFDGFSGRAWLSRDTCLQHANVSIVHHDGWCPHGGQLSVDPETLEDIPPHRFCSRYFNYSYRVDWPPTEEYVREVSVQPDVGELDDLGYSEVLERIAAKRMDLAASMHYPTQLRIRSEIEDLEQEAIGVSRTNATWKRRWYMRLCTK